MIYRFILRSAFRPFVTGTSRRALSAVAAPASARSNFVPFLIASTVGAGALAYKANCSSDNEGKARRDIADAIEVDDKKREDGTSIAGTLIRLAWHAAGTYSVRDGTGGSNGAYMRFSPESNWGCNAGLKLARDFMEPIKAKNPNMSYADLWTLASVVAIEKMGGPKIPWRSGRTDAAVGTTVPDGRLPGADNGGVKQDISHFREIFGRLGFSDRESVALLGAHAVGRCHTDASGFWGPWTNAETTFSNDYFRVLLETKWTQKKTHLGKVKLLHAHMLYYSELF